MNRTKKVWLGLAAGALAAAGFAGVGTIRTARATVADAQRVLGCEDAADWTGSAGVVVSSDDTRTQGSRSIAVRTNGYGTVTSRFVGPLGAVSGAIRLDLRVPAVQPNPYWVGAIQLFVSAPSAGIYNQYLGQRDLSALQRGAFTQLAFPLDGNLRQALSGQVFDASFTVVLNVPAGLTDPYLIDNVQVSPSLPGITTIGPNDLARVLGFESVSDWSTSAGSISGSFAPRAQGNLTLRVDPAGYTVVRSAPMTSLAPVDSKVSFRLRLPSEQPNPWWWGAVQLYVDAPSLGLHRSYVGQKELLGLTTNAFNLLEFELPAATRAALNAQTSADLRFEIALNVPGGAGPYYLDDVQVGTVTEPPAPVVFTPRPDYVGMLNSGAVGVKVDAEEASAGLLYGTYEVRLLDEGCRPSATVEYRYVLSTVRFRLGPVAIAGQSFTQIKLSNNVYIPFTLGGSFGSEFTIPNGTEFIGWISGAEPYVASLSASGVRFSFSPNGDGFMSLSGDFVGNVMGRAIELSFVATANTPLANQPPVANAGANRTVTKGTGTCSVNVSLDGSASSDPNGNIESYRWLFRGARFALGPTATATVTRSGTYELDLALRDSFNSTSTDSMLLTVNLPAGCPSL